MRNGFQELKCEYVKAENVSFTASGIGMYTGKKSVATEA